MRIIINVVFTALFFYGFWAKQLTILSSFYNIFTLVFVAFIFSYIFQWKPKKLKPIEPEVEEAFLKVNHLVVKAYLGPGVIYLFCALFLLNLFCGNPKIQIFNRFCQTYFGRSDYETMSILWTYGFAMLVMQDIFYRIQMYRKNIVDRP